MRPLLTGIYTLTPTHCGTGQASDAIDLPIAREVTTGLPILPATSLKGAARAAFERGVEEGWPTKGDIDALFGPEAKGPGATGDDDGDRGLRAGQLSIGEGQLLLYPFRALRPPLAFATCPLLLERLARALRARKEPKNHPVLAALDGEEWKASLSDLRANKTLVGAQPTGPLVIEDRLIPAGEQAKSALASKVGAALGTLLPDEEGPTRDRIARDLIILPDTTFQELVRRVTPVNARVKLTSGKTTSRYTPPGEEQESGNLWYEETLPSDCLFWCLIEPRPGGGRRGAPDVQETLFPNPSDRSSDAPTMSSVLHTTQIGGNETVGQGLCLWTVRRPA